jgi:hypothetical protein
MRDHGGSRFVVEVQNLAALKLKPFRSIQALQGTSMCLGGINSRAEKRKGFLASVFESLLLLNGPGQGSIQRLLDLEYEAEPRPLGCYWTG